MYSLGAASVMSFPVYDFGENPFHKATGGKDFSKAFGVKSFQISPGNELLRSFSMSADGNDFLRESFHDGFLPKQGPVPWKSLFCLPSEKYRAEANIGTLLFIWECLLGYNVKVVGLRFCLQLLFLEGFGKLSVSVELIRRAQRFVTTLVDLET